VILPWSRPVALVALRGTIGVGIRAEREAGDQAPVGDNVEQAGGDRGQGA